MGRAAHISSVLGRSKPFTCDEGTDLERGKVGPPDRTSRPPSLRAYCLSPPFQSQLMHNNSAYLFIDYVIM